MIHTHTSRSWIPRKTLARYLISLVVLPVLLGGAIHFVISEIRACDATFRK